MSSEKLIRKGLLSELDYYSTLTLGTVTPFSDMYPLLTDQLTWQFTMFDGPSNLGWYLDAAIVDGLADQDIIPFYIDWLRAIGGVFSPCLPGWPRTVTEVLTLRQADLEVSPLSTDQPSWYLTHILWPWAGQTNKKPIINRSAGHWINPIVNLPATLTKVHYELAT